MRVAEKPGGVVTLEAAEVLFAVVAGEVEGEGGVGGGGVGGGGGLEAGVKGPGAAGQGVPFGPFVDGEELAWRSGRRGRSPRG